MDTQGTLAIYFPMSQLTHICDRSVEAEWVTAETTRGSHQRKHCRKGATVLSSEEEDSEGVHAGHRPEMDDAPYLLYIHWGNASFPHVKKEYFADGYVDITSERPAEAEVP